MQRVYGALIEKTVKDQLIGYISRDSTEMEGREKPKKKEFKKEKAEGKRGRPKKGEERVKEASRLVRQQGMRIEEMVEELLKECDVGSTRNSKGCIES